MFNKLESVATVPQPQTPVLGCTISKSLEPKNVGTYVSSYQIKIHVLSDLLGTLTLYTTVDKLSGLFPFLKGYFDMHSGKVLKMYKLVAQQQGIELGT